MRLILGTNSPFKQANSYKEKHKGGADDTALEIQGQLEGDSVELQEDYAVDLDDTLDSEDRYK